MSSGSRAEKEALRVSREIARRVYREKIPTGARIASEEEALATYGVSRGTLREALRYLQLHGVIELRTGPNGGQFVADPQWQDLASTIALLLQFADATVEHVMEVRRYLDPGMAALAAQNASTDDIDHMEALITQMQDSVRDSTAFHDDCVEYWDVLARSSANPLFSLLSPALRRITWRAGTRLSIVERRKALAQMRAIHLAICSHDSVQAHREMELLETSYMATMRRKHAAEIRKIVSWSDSNT